VGISLGHPIFERSLLTARGDVWKQIRTIVSPTFSSGKMRKMQILIKDCVERVDNKLETLANSENNEIDIKKVFVNYTMDVIALCAFATKLQSHSGAEEHPFIHNASQFFRPTVRFGLFFILNQLMPSIVKKYDISFLPKHYINYFKTTLETIITERQSQKGPKNVDFLQLLIDAQNRTDTKDIDEDIRLEVQRISESMKKKGFQLQDMDILATALLFVLAGYETTASTLSYLFHELALNPESQHKLFEEITKFGPNVEYETIEKMPYLDACISETLRLYSPLVMSQRIASEDYDLGDTGLVVHKGMAVHIPLYAIHHDPQYYPSPDRFIPDRFMPENKDRLIPYTYLPFGTGPRNCVGM
ncbi:unnamed protein product, partial [Medioppia subpectinata]